jgi:hypothetical protein
VLRCTLRTADRRHEVTKTRRVAYSSLLDNHVIGDHGIRDKDETLGTMVTIPKTIRRLQESKCRSYDDLGKPGTSDGTGRFIRYRRDGQGDTKTKRVMVVVNGLVGGKETGMRRSDVDRFVKCIETEGLAIVL